VIDHLINIDGRSLRTAPHGSVLEAEPGGRDDGVRGQPGAQDTELPSPAALPPTESGPGVRPDGVA